MAKTLALCMIVKNEQQYLPYAIGSVIKYIDELIIVDTGSTDKTIEIAEGFCKQVKQGIVIQMPWIYDFAVARNISQAPVKSDWILWLDADEIMNDEGIKKIKEILINDNTCDFYLLPRLNFWKDLKHVAWYPDSQYKVYRNNNIRWRGKIHEKIFDETNITHRARLKQTDVHTFHYAYLKQEDEVAEKMFNYIKIENPDMEDNKIRKCSREHSFFYKRENDFVQPYAGIYPEIFHRIVITKEYIRWKDGPIICRFSKKMKSLNTYKDVNQINEENPAYEYIEPDWSEYKDSLTSIVIATYNKLEYLKPCIQGIYQSTKVPFEVILVDNGSDQVNIQDFANQMLSQYDNFKFIRSDENLGFAKGYNLGIEHSKGEYIVILNNDTRVTEGWIGSFINHYNSRDDIALIGPVSNNIHGEHQMIPLHAGASFGDYLTLMVQLKKKEENHLLRESSWITGCCMFFHRNLLNELAMNNRHCSEGIFFDASRFRIGMAEDSDLIFRCHHEVHKKVFVARDVFIWHEGQKTLNDVTQKEGISVEALQHDNNLELRRKWGKEIFPDYEE